MSKLADSLPAPALPATPQRVASGTRVRTLESSTLPRPIGASHEDADVNLIPAGTGRRLRPDVAMAHSASGVSLRAAPESPLRYLASLIIAAPLGLLTMLVLCLYRAGED